MDVIQNITQLAAEIKDLEAAGQKLEEIEKQEAAAFDNLPERQAMLKALSAVQQAEESLQQARAFQTSCETAWTAKKNEYLAQQEQRNQKRTNFRLAVEERKAQIGRLALNLAGVTGATAAPPSDEEDEEEDDEEIPENDEISGWAVPGTVLYAKFKFYHYYATQFVEVFGPGKNLHTEVLRARGFDESGTKTRDVGYARESLRFYSTSIEVAAEGAYEYLKLVPREYWPEGFTYPEDGKPLTYLFRKVDWMLIRALGQEAPLTDGEYLTLVRRKQKVGDREHKRKVEEMLPGLRYTPEGTETPRGVPWEYLLRRLTLHSQAVRGDKRLFEKTGDNPQDWRLTRTGEQVFNNYIVQGALIGV